MGESRLRPEVDFDGLGAAEAFSVLGNEIRLDIVRVLWQAGAVTKYDDIRDDDETLSFSELRRRVDLRDNGRFNYHVSKLVPAFVRRTESGYRLSEAGKQLARTVVAVSEAEDVAFSRTLERDCPLCGGAMAVGYRDGWLRVRCTDCSGLFGDEAPAGTLYNAPYPAQGLADWSPERAVENGLYRCILDNVLLVRGLCSECGGRVTGSLVPAERHGAVDGDRARANGGQGPRFAAWAEQRCDTCRYAKRLPVELFVLGLTPVVAFLDRTLGIDALSLSFDEVVVLVTDHVRASVTGEPTRVTVTVTGDGDELELTLDEELRQVAVDCHD